MALTDDGIPSNLENRPKSKGWKWEKDPLGPKFFLTRIQSDILMHKNVEKRESVFDSLWRRKSRYLHLLSSRNDSFIHTRIVYIIRFGLLIKRICWSRAHKNGAARAICWSILKLTMAGRESGTAEPANNKPIETALVRSWRLTISQTWKRSTLPEWEAWLW